jgi:hypothetical protein
VLTGGAARIYDNSVHNQSTRFDPGTNEVGDEIVLAPGDRCLTKFSFEFWGTNTLSPFYFAGVVQARVRLYLNDGPITAYGCYPTPGTRLFDSGWFELPPIPRATAEFSGGLIIPAARDLTWSVQFQGMGPTDSVGLDIYSNAVIGYSYDDYWENSGGDWELKINRIPMSFGATFEAARFETQLNSPAQLPAGGFIFLVSGTAPQGSILEASTNLLTWVPLATNAPTSTPFWVTNSSPRSLQFQFFRIADAARPYINDGYYIGPPYVPLSANPTTIHTDTSTNLCPPSFP